MNGSPNQQETFLHFMCLGSSETLRTVSDKNKTVLDIDYKSYRLIEKQLVPKKIMINVSQPEHYTTITIDFKSVTLNKQISTPYKIPSSYKPIKL